MSELEAGEEEGSEAGQVREEEDQRGSRSTRMAADENTQPDYYAPTSSGYNGVRFTAPGPAIYATLTVYLWHKQS